jgi:hypothetical protein
MSKNVKNKENDVNKSSQQDLVALAVLRLCGGQQDLSAQDSMSLPEETMDG